MKCFFLVIYREDIDIDMLDTELKTWLGYKLKFNLNDIQSIHAHFIEKNLKLEVEYQHMTECKVFHI